MVNEAHEFLKRLSAPIPPNSGMTAEEIEAQQREVQERHEAMRRKKKDEEERESESYKPSQIDDEKPEVQTPTPQEEKPPEPTEERENRFVSRIKRTVEKIDKRIDEKADELDDWLEDAPERALDRAKTNTAAFGKSVKKDFQKATEYKAPKKNQHRPLVSAEDRRRSADFAVRDFERRHTMPRQNDFTADEVRTNPFFGFSHTDVNGYGELQRDSFSLDSSQFGFNLIGDSGIFQGERFVNEKPFGGFNVKQERGFNVSYSGEFGAFKHSRNESFSFLPQPKGKGKGKRAGKQKTNDFNISDLIF